MIQKISARFKTPEDLETEQVLGYSTDIALRLLIVIMHEGYADQFSRTQCSTFTV